MINIKEKQNLSRKKIINSAIKFFAKKGYEATSTRDICNDAGVNISLISYYFKNKEGLYLEIIKSIVNYGLEFMQEDILRANDVNSMTREEKIAGLRVLLEKYLEFIYSENVPNEFVVMMLEEQMGESKFGEAYSKTIQVFYLALRRFLGSLLEKSENDSFIIFKVSSLVGQILSFKFMSRPTLFALKRSFYIPKDVEMIKEIITAQLSANLEQLGIK